MVSHTGRYQGPIAWRSGTSCRELMLLLLAAAFVLVNLLGLSLAVEGKIVVGYLIPFAIWAAVVSVVFLTLSRRAPTHDVYLLPLVAFLSGWGLVLIGRLAPNFLWRQIIWLVIGLIMMLVIAIVPRNLRLLRRYRYTWLFLGLFLLASTFIFGVNPAGYGAALWLPVPLVGRVYFQPSEMLKLLLVVFLASYFSEREHLLKLTKSMGRLGALPYLGPLLIMWGFCVLLLVWQRDLGAAVLFFLIFLALLYLATGDWRYLAGGFILLLLAGVIGYYAFDVVALRVDTWLNPWPEATDRGFQIVQSLYAVAAGRVFGQGVGQGFPTYIPVVHSDFAFAAIAEEWGLLGSLTVVVGFVFLAHRGLHLASRARWAFDMYLAAGIAMLFAVQAFLIMGGVTKLIPLTGVTLPFVSYGGSSLLLSSAMVGFLLYLSIER
jgi:cell division protein FtsW (lipid II flippase)